MFRSPYPGLFSVSNQEARRFYVTRSPILYSRPQRFTRKEVIEIDPTHLNYNWAPRSGSALPVNPSDLPLPLFCLGSTQLNNRHLDRSKKQSYRPLRSGPATPHLLCHTSQHLLPVPCAPEHALKIARPPENPVKPLNSKSPRQSRRFALPSNSTQPAIMVTVELRKAPAYHRGFSYLYRFKIGGLGENRR